MLLSKLKNKPGDINLPVLFFIHKYMLNPQTANEVSDIMSIMSITLPFLFIIIALFVKEDKHNGKRKTKTMENERR